MIILLPSWFFAHNGLLQFFTPAAQIASSFDTAHPSHTVAIESGGGPIGISSHHRALNFTTYTQAANSSGY